MLTEHEKELFKDWTPLDFRLVFERVNGSVDEKDRKWFDAVRDYIVFNELYNQYLEAHSGEKDLMSRERYELALKMKFSPIGGIEYPNREEGENEGKQKE
jgi:hypothetical protein